MTKLEEDTLVWTLNPSVASVVLTRAEVWLISKVSPETINVVLDIMLLVVGWPEEVILDDV